MGKIFVTDEVRPDYTLDVTNAGKVKVENGAASFAKVSSAYSAISGQTLSSSPCFLKSITFGQFPQTAASFTIYDTGTSAGGISGFGSSGANVVATFVWDSGAASAMVCGKAAYSPLHFPMNVYLTSGLTVANSVSAFTGYKGCVDNVTVMYQA